MRLISAQSSAGRTHYGPAPHGAAIESSDEERHISLNRARTASASSNVRRLSLAVMAMARRVLATMAADSGVLL